MKTLAFTTCLILGAASLLFGAAKIFPYEYVQEDLPNGLRLITIPTDYPNIVSLFIVVRTGSRNEIEPGKSGFAHLFEHLMFRGTPEFSPEKYNAALKDAGAASNAFTTDDFTAYHTTSSSTWPMSSPLSRPRRGRCWANTTRTVRIRFRSSVKCCAPRRSPPTPTGTPPWASSPTSKRCRTNTTTAASFSTATIGPNIRRLLSRATWTPSACVRWSTSAGVRGNGAATKRKSRLSRHKTALARRMSIGRRQ